MGSEGPSSTRIFFKDKNEFQGPFNERRIQEWYRLGLFENACLFYFVKPGTASDDSTSSFALEELCSLNGNHTPFKCPSDAIPAEKT
ncbi:hypothetical protein PMAYCL1PPCAC_00562, partial [Pristionchus mayeri]